MIALSSNEPAVSGGIPLRQDYLAFGGPRAHDAAIEDAVAVVRPSRPGASTRTVRFEASFAACVGADYAVAVGDCSTALPLALLAAGIGPGDEVILPAMAPVATANSVVRTGATPVLCDVDPQTQTMRAADAARVRTARTRAVIPVHFAGRAAEMADLQTLARDHGFTIISEASHAVETEHQGWHIPAWGELTVYGFPIARDTRTGNGGIVVTGDPKLAERLRTLRRQSHPASGARRQSAGAPQGENPAAGFNPMREAQAVVGLRELAQIEDTNAVRHCVWTRYTEAFADLPLDCPPPTTPGDRHGLHLYTVQLDLDQVTIDRDSFAQALHLEGIGTGVHYRAVHLHPYYRHRLGYTTAALPHASRLSERTLSLPMSATLTDRDVADVIAAVRRVLLRFKR